MLKFLWDKHCTWSLILQEDTKKELLVITKIENPDQPSGQWVVDKIAAYDFGWCTNILYNERYVNTMGPMSLE